MVKCYLNWKYPDFYSNCPPLEIKIEKTLELDENKLDAILGAVYNSL